MADGIVCVNLTTPRVVEEVVFGESGLAAALHDNALIIDFGTTGVPATKDFSERMGGRWIDAPVSGGRSMPRQGI